MKSVYFDHELNDCKSHLLLLVGDGYAQLLKKLSEKQVATATGTSLDESPICVFTRDMSSGLMPAGSNFYDVLNTDLCLTMCKVEMTGVGIIGSC